MKEEIFKEIKNIGGTIYKKPVEVIYKQLPLKKQELFEQEFSKRKKACIAFDQVIDRKTLRELLIFIQSDEEIITAKQTDDNMSDEFLIEVQRSPVSGIKLARKTRVIAHIKSRTLT